VGSDGQITVKMGALSMQVDAADAAPVSQSKASRVAAATKASGAGPKKSRDGMLALIHCKLFTAACWQTTMIGSGGAILDCLQLSLVQSPA
jgi:hypothetical protein